MARRQSHHEIVLEQQQRVVLAKLPPNVARTPLNEPTAKKARLAPDVETYRAALRFYIFDQMSSERAVAMANGDRREGTGPVRRSAVKKAMEEIRFLKEHDEDWLTYNVQIAQETKAKTPEETEPEVLAELRRKFDAIEQDLEDIQEIAIANFLPHPEAPADWAASGAHREKIVT